MGKDVKISISPELVKTQLQNLFDKAGAHHSELLARMIVENLVTTEVGMVQLIFAFMGVEEKLPWLIGDTCLIHPDYVSSWDCDKDKMIQDKHNMHNSHFIAKITDINMRQERNIKYEFEGLDRSSNGGGPKKITGSAPASTVKIPLGLPREPSIGEGKREGVADML